MSTANLDVTYIASNQNQKEVTANAAFDAFDGALGSLLAHTMTDADYTLNLSASPNEALGYLAYVFTGTLTANRNIIVPTNKKLYAVWNNTTAGKSLVVKTSSGTGITVAYSSTAAYTLLYCDGTNVDAVGGSSSGGGSGAVTNTLGSLTEYAVVIGNGGDDETILSSLGTSGQVLTSAGAGNPPAWQTPSGGGGGGGATGTFHALGIASTGAITTFGCSPVSAGGSVGGPYTSNPGSQGPPPYGYRLQAASTFCALQDAVNQMTPALTQQIQFYVAAGQTTVCRMWLGFGNAGGSTLAATNPASSLIAFRFDASVDTFWTAYVSNGASFTATPTTIAPDTNFHQFKITADGFGGWNFYIDGTLVANIPTGSTGMPTSTTQMLFTMEVDSASTTANLYVNSMQWWSNF